MLIFDENERKDIIKEITLKLNDSESLIDDEFLTQLFLVPNFELDKIKNMSADDIKSIIKTIKDNDKHYIKELDHMNLEYCNLENIGIKQLRQYASAKLVTKLIYEQERKQELINKIENFNKSGISLDDELMKRLRLLSINDLDTLSYISGFDSDHSTKILSELRFFDENYTMEDYGNVDCYGMPLKEKYNMDKMSLDDIKKIATINVAGLLIYGETKEQQKQR